MAKQTKNTKTEDDFIELRDVWGTHTMKILRSEHKRRLVKGLFNIGRIRKAKAKIAEKITKKNIIRVTCAVNVFIPLTFWVITNPIITKGINAVDLDKMGRVLNLLKAGAL